MEEQEEIIEGCKRNDRHSQEKLYRQFYAGMFALCKKYFKDNENALTALNNGMLTVFKNIGKYDTAKGSLFNWIYTIVRNSALTHLRNISSNWIRQRFSINDEFAERYINEAEISWGDLNYYIEQLPDATESVFTEYYIQGLSIKEIAVKMNISEGTVKWHLSDGRKRLRNQITGND